MTSVVERLCKRLALVAKVRRCRSEFAGIGDDLTAAIVEIERLTDLLVEAEQIGVEEGLFDPEECSFYRSERDEENAEAADEELNQAVPG